MPLHCNTVSAWLLCNVAYKYIKPIILAKCSAPLEEINTMYAILKYTH